MNKFKLLTLIVLPVIFVALIASLLAANISPYVSVTELKAGNMVNRNLQVFGQAVVDTIQLNTQTGILTFDLTDGNNTVTIRHRGMVNNLRNSTEVVAIGEYRDGVFQAEKLLVKCPSKYEEIKEEG